MDFDTGRLRAFVQVAERGTVAAAAGALGYTAPAVSQQVAKLEAQLGVRLFDRYGGRLRPSDHGRRLLPLAQQLLELADAATAATAPTAAAARRHVVVAGFASALRAVVVPLLSAPEAAGVAFDVREAEDDVALRDLRLGHVDLAIVQEYDGIGPARSARLAYVELARDRLRLLAPPAFAPTVGLADLAEAGWLVNGAGTRCEQATQQLLRAAGIRPRIAGHVADNETLLALVAAGHGATIAPELVVGPARATVTVADADLGAHRTIYGVTRPALLDGLRPILQLTVGLMSAAAPEVAAPPAAASLAAAAVSGGRRRAAPRAPGRGADGPPRW